MALRETGSSTGIFTEMLRFTLDEESAGNRVRVSDGDTLTLKYTDSTLPPPAALSADGIETVEVREIVASSVFGKLLPVMGRIQTSQPALISSSSEAIAQVSIGEQILIQSEVTNVQNRKQPFAYIVKVGDAEGITASLSWITSELPPGESLKVAQSWIPQEPGDYTVEVFVWESLGSPVPLSPSGMINVRVD